MRVERWFAEAARAVACERREIERGGRVVEVVAPAAWPDARVEAWLDWAETVHGPTTSLPRRLGTLGGRRNGSDTGRGPGV